MKVDVDIQGVDGVLRTLQSLPKEVVSKRGGPVARALAKGARVIRDQARKNVAAGIAARDGESTGLLEKNIVATRGKRGIADSKGEKYLVRVRRKAYRGRTQRSRDVATTRKVAHLLEYGSSHQPAYPWLRPAVKQKGREAINVMTADLKRRVDIEVKKLAAKNSQVL